MATSGKEKYNKYFLNNFVETKTTNKVHTIPLYESIKTNKVLDYISPNTKILVLPQEDWQGRYKIQIENKVGYVSDRFVSKPIHQKLRTTFSKDFAKFSDEGRLTWCDQDILTYRFSSSIDLKESIKTNIKENPEISLESKLSIKKYMDCGDLCWNNCEIERRRLGVILGELFVAIDWKFEGQRIKYFHIPQNSNFSGIDSFIELENKIIPISNKFSSGAKASFFSNILPFCKPQNKLLNEFINSIEKQNISKSDLISHSGSKKILYDVGCKLLLKNEQESAIDLYKKIKENTIDEQTKEILEQIENYEGIDEIVKKNLNKSITAFFSRGLSKKMNEECLEYSKEVLNLKNFVQVNLNYKSWMDGKLEYDFKYVKDLKIRFVGNKSSVTDISARQGMINYELY